MRVLLSASVLLLSAATVSAQESRSPSPPRLELFVGYRTQTVPDDQRYLSPGINHSHLDVGVDWNVIPRVAFVITSPSLSVGKYYGEDWRVDYAFLMGPRVRFAERGRWLPFASFLAGPAHGFVTPGRDMILAVPFSRPARYTALQIAVGGGVDLRVNDRYAVRVVELRDHKLVTGPETDNSIAAFTGVVFRFGGRK